MKAKVVDRILLCVAGLNGLATNYCIARGHEIVAMGFAAATALLTIPWLLHLWNAWGCGRDV